MKSLQDIVDIIAKAESLKDFKDLCLPPSAFNCQILSTQQLYFESKIQIPKGSTILMLAIAREWDELVEYIFEKYHDKIDYFQHAVFEGYTALRCAILVNNSNYMEQILSFSFENIDESHHNYIRSNFYTIVGYGYVKLLLRYLDFFCNKGIDFNIPDEYDDSKTPPLEITIDNFINSYHENAINDSFIEIAYILLAHKIDNINLAKYSQISEGGVDVKKVPLLEILNILKKVSEKKETIDAKYSDILEKYGYVEHICANCNATDKLEYDVEYGYYLCQICMEKKHR